MVDLSVETRQCIISCVYFMPLRPYVFDGELSLYIFSTIYWFSWSGARVPFVFYEDCKEAFEILKKALITAPIVQPPNWNLPFEIMCNASDYAVWDVLGQRIDKKLNGIHYASETLDNAQKNNATTDKEFLAVFFACDKSRHYIVDSKVTIHTDHAAIKYLMEK